jgi:hypothetical protein
LVHQVLLFLALNLNSLEAFGGQVLRVINVNHVFVLWLSDHRFWVAGLVIQDLFYGLGVLKERVLFFV